MSPIALGLVHALDLAAIGALLGGLVFERAVRVPPRGLSFLGALSFFTTLLWAIWLSADVSDSWSFTVLEPALLQMRFGQLALARVGLAALVWMLAVAGWRGFALLVALALPWLSAEMGHAGAAGEGGLADLFLDYGHFVAVAVWAGGLLQLWRWLGTRPTPEEAREAVVRFSWVAMVCVASIFGLGVTLAWRYGVRPHSLAEIAYGRVLLVKLGFFLPALAVASRHRRIHLRVPRELLTPAFIRAVRRDASRELFLIGAVFAAAGVLTRLSPS